jgi:hypothetical protein
MSDKRRDISSGKIEMVDVVQICSNFDLTEEEIKEFIEEGLSTFEVKNEQSPETPESGDLPRFSIRLCDSEHEQKE